MAVKSVRLFTDNSLNLLLGGQLKYIDIAYQTYGRLNAEKSNAVLICHALTGDAEPYIEPRQAGSEQKGWWQNFMGAGLALDTDHYFFICSNVLGGCKGSTGPSSINPSTNKPYGSQFPAITIQDIVKAEKALLDELQIPHLHAVIGGSFGGMQATQWAVDYPDRVARVVNLCSSLYFSAEAIGFNHVMRQAIVTDPNFNNGDYYADKAPEQGLAVARMLGMLTYRTDIQLNKAFGRAQKQSPEYFGDYFQVESYLSYQGKKFLDRFDANSYLHLTRALDLYDPAMNYNNDIKKALSRIKARYTLVAVANDQLFKTPDMHKSKQLLQETGVQLDYHEFYSDFGHDAFLVEYELFESMIRKGLL
ncbi:homoserine O-acetyltransferase MetX [Testudinibacter aquarius]|uniref:Homoserine O-acetyltransferase n=1 Tax=Testudinibacter aquarius TaxID=1524974 RepID=A0A4V2W292_9PAST|nr:homoserine O-acetyltransferase [Testudinibacter aquarius]KAE9526312.1 homoserine O-acetyltransferase [Testudinibacter aquarius]TCV87129.1 homoserine O-acetyltransferase [Testudinibacter aquarius]TNG92502.1 homoserine O-acetyltransferase [Testudinibacter aquarius]